MGKGGILLVHLQIELGLMKSFLKPRNEAIHGFKINT
jgi:hypothetical protein